MKKTMALLAVMVMAVSSWGAMYSEDFTGSDGTVPTDWTVLSGIAEIQDNALYVGPQVSGDSAFNRAIYSGTGSSAWSDYELDVDWMTTRELATGGSSSLYTGVYLYASVQSSDASKMNGYLLRLRDSSYSSYCRLYISKEVEGTIYDMSFVTMSSWSEDEWFNLNVSIENQLNGTVTIDAVMTDASDNEIGSVSAVDDGSKGGNPFYAGSVGVSGIFSYSSSDYHAEYDNMTITPEPMTLGLLALGGVLSLRRRG